jgi:RNA-binding protein Musashi
MFIGGLNWDTTDGTSSLYTSIYVALIFTYYSSYAFPPNRRSKALLLRIWKGTRTVGRCSINLLQLAKVDACTIMRDPAGTSRGFAFLTFEDPTSVNAVVVREHYLDGKAVCTME